MVLQADSKNYSMTNCYLSLLNSSKTNLFLNITVVSEPRFVLHFSLIAFSNTEISFDEKTFARKVVKIYRTIRKMEYSKNLEPNFSESFSELSDILLSNYKDSSSMNSSVIGGQTNSADYYGPV